MNVPYRGETALDPKGGGGASAPTCLSSAAHGAETLAGLRSICLEAEVRIATLTPREREVFGLITRGLTNKETALALGCSPRTVEIHRSHLMFKLDASSSAELVCLAIYGNLSDLIRRTAG